MDHIKASMSQLAVGGSNSTFLLGCQGQNIPVKVTVVNEDGLIVLDTLIRPCIDGIDQIDVDAIPNYRSLSQIHGIKKAWLRDAPSLESVREHIDEICGKVEIKDKENAAEASGDMKNTGPSAQQDGSALKDSKEGGEALMLEKEETRKREFEGIDPMNYNEKIHSTLIGHGVVMDLKVLTVCDVPYVCTA